MTMDSDTTKHAPSSKKVCSSFAVCTNIKLGTLLPAQSQSQSRTVWKLVSKNKNSSDPDKIQRDPRRIARYNHNPRDAEHVVSKLEGMSQLQVAKTESLVFSDFLTENLLAKAVHVAFYEHYPLKLSPDVIWLTILQGLAKHIDQDPESQRANFVDFDKKRTITVRRPEFIKGSPKNDWTTVFPEFAGSIASYIGKEKATTLSCNFSTSKETDQICSHIALMDTVKHYFEYMMVCGCGIHSIELLGCVDDWRSLRRKAEILNKFDLDWWTEELFPVLDQFVSAAEGHADIKFWKSVCNLYGASGFWMDYVTGWVQVLFPYLNSGERNHSLDGWRVNYKKGNGHEIEDYNRGDKPRGFSHEHRDSVGYGLKLKHIPAGVSQAPVIYVDLPSAHNGNTEHRYDMTFNGGIVGILQDKKTRALEPVTGWAVLEHGELL